MIDKNKTITQIMTHTAKAKRHHEQINGFRDSPKTVASEQLELDKELSQISWEIDAWIDERIDLALKGKAKPKAKKGKGKDSDDGTDLF